MADIRLAMSSPQSPVNFSVTSAKLTTTEYMHDVLEATVIHPMMNTLTPFVSGLPVQLTWRAARHGRSGIFYGYVDRVSAPYARSGGTMQQAFAELRCYGTSYWLKDEGYATFSKRTADGIVRSFATSFGLSVVADPHPYVWPTYTQGGLSGWAFLSELAKRIGYTLFMQGTVLYFLDRRTAGGRITRPYGVVLGGSPGAANSALEFRPQASGGDGLEERSGIHTVRGVSDSSGKALLVSQEIDTPRYGNTIVNSRLFNRTIPHRTATSVLEARTYTTAAESASLFTSRATLVVPGNASLSVGGLIELAIKDASQKQFSGTWYILEAHHVLNPQRYVTRLTIGTDAAGQTQQQPKYVGLQTQLRLPPTVYRAGAWQAKWAA